MMRTDREVERLAAVAAETARGALAHLPPRHGARDHLHVRDLPTWRIVIQAVLDAQDLTPPPLPGDPGWDEYLLGRLAGLSSPDQSDRPQQSRSTWNDLTRTH